MISEANLKAKVKILIGVALVGAVCLLAYEVFYWFTHVYENDVRVQTDFTNISSRIDGKIETVHVRDGSKVSQGQLIVTLEHEDIRLNIAALETDLALEQGHRKRLMIERDVLEEEISSKMATQHEKIRTLKTELASVEGRLKLARKDLSRVGLLVRKRLKPESLLIVEQDKTLVLEGRASFLRGNVLVAKKELDQLIAEKRKLSVIDKNIQISFIKENKIRDEIKKQELLMRHRHIMSPINGVVGKIHKYKGEYVEDGINILMLHDPVLYWVEAYVDEGQIRHVRVGQEVLIHLDAYPFEDFYGRVQRIGSITTRNAANGNGAAAKLGGSVERVPVRISIDNPPPNITPGMRGDVNIRIYKNIRLWSR